MIIIQTATDDLGALPDFLKQCVYNGMDSMLTHEIWEAVAKLADKHQSWDAYYDTRSYIPDILDMSNRGIKINTAKRDELLADLKRRVRRLDRYLQLYAKRVWGKGLNHRSPLQLQQFFFEALALPIKYSAKKGDVKVSTGRDALEALGNEYVRAMPFTRIILKLRDYEKLIQTLTVGLHDGRWRFSFNAAGTDTARWSSSAHPKGDGGNIQNIKDLVRKIFEADEEYDMWNFDQQGAEARVVAYLSGDEAYIAAVETGDVHTMVAAMCFGFEPRRELAEQKYYREWSYRDISKRATHGCVTADHDVLTATGWKPIVDVTTDDMVACWDKADGSIKFQHPISTTAYAYTGQMHELNGTAFSLRATHDHRMPYKVDDSDVTHECILAELVKKKSARVPVNGQLATLAATPDEILWARRLAAVHADGNLSTGYVRFHLKKQRKLARVEELFGPQHWMASLTCEGAKFCQVPTAVFNVDAAYAKPGWYMLAWSRDMLAAWLDESRYWDSHVAPGGTVTFHTAVQNTADLYQTIAALVGRGSVYKGFWPSGYGAGCHRVSQNRRQYARLSSMDVKVESVVDEMVYCLTVPTTFFLVRRNGKISVTGNTSYGGTARTIARVTKLEEKIIEEFQAKLRRNFPGIFEWQRWVAHQIQTKGELVTPLGFRRKFFGRRHDDSTVRAAIAFVPQSTVGRHTANGIRRLRALQDPAIVCLSNGHDAVTGQTPTLLIPEKMPLIRRTLIKPFPVVDIHGKERIMTIPWDGAVGRNWGKYHKDKNPNGLREYKWA